MTFKRAVLEFTEPLCSCDEQKVTWNVSSTPAPPGKQIETPYLVVCCEICKTTLYVPAQKFKAAITFDKPYPGKPKPKEKIVEVKISEEEQKIQEELQAEIKKKLKN